MKISEKVLEFLNREDVQDALVRNDTQELYKLAVGRTNQGDLQASDIGELTSILMQAGIDPLLGMTEIPMCFLCGQKGIKEFNIPMGITKINGYAFENTDLESITIPSSVGEIGSSTFYNCEDLKTVKLPAGVELRGHVFSSSGLESIELKDVKLQSYATFRYCGQLKSVVIKGDTPIIPNEIFASCYKLTHVELPETLKLIGRDVFYGCTELREIKFAGTMEQWKNIEISTFDTVLSTCSIICPDGTLKYDSDAGEWKQVR